VRIFKANKSTIHTSFNKVSVEIYPIKKRRRPCKESRLVTTTGAQSVTTADSLFFSRYYCKSILLLIWGSVFNVILLPCCYMLRVWICCVCRMNTPSHTYRTSDCEPGVVLCRLVYTYIRIKKSGVCVSWSIRVQNVCRPIAKYHYRQ